MQGASDCDNYFPGTLLEARYTELDPIVHGFSGALLELRRAEHEGYEVRQVAVATGNRLFVFTTADEARARAVLESAVREGGLMLASLCGA